MDFRLLGPFEVVDGGRPLKLGPRKQRAVLALLALDANRVVSLDRLIDELWGDAPPAAATGSLQAYISNLRRILEPERASGEPPRVLATRAPGYILHVDPACLDVARFEAASGEGRRLMAAGRPAEARPFLHRALEEWRGAALADFAFDPFAQVGTGRLEELRLRTLEDRVQADLDLGAHGDVVAEAEVLVRTHPLRERLWGLLMVALYRCGRQADALRAYQSARRVLGEELGIEPGPALRRLEADILAQSPSLELMTPVPEPMPVLPVPVSAGPGPHLFIGRQEELGALKAALSRAASGRGGAVWVTGEAGIGKTRLAEELAAEARRRGVAVAWGESIEGGGTPAYWPLVGVVRSLLEGTDPERLPAALATTAPELAQIVPEVKHVSAPFDPLPALDPETPECGSSRPWRRSWGGWLSREGSSWSSTTSSGPTGPRSSC